MHFNRTSAAALLFLFAFCGNFMHNALAADPPIQCYKCDTDNCAKLEDSQKQDCKEGEICYTKIENGKVIRGCIANTDTTCTEPNNCLKCSTANCNTNLICRKCEGDNSCEQKDAGANQVCPLNSKCIMQVNDDKKVTRGCATDEQTKACDNKKDTCTTCADPSCNADIFPTNRIQCYKCDGTTCNDVSSLTAKPCSLYDKDDKCYTIGESETAMIRGCQSDIDTKCKADSTDAKCATCSESSCNKLQFKRKPSLKCIQCENCEGLQKVDDAKACVSDIPYTQPAELCYTEEKTAGVNRGCSSDRTAAQGDCTGNCKTCGTAGCNIDAVSLQFTCIRCRSDVEPKCNKEAKDLEGQLCNNKTLGCYYGIWNDVMIRSCLEYASERVQYQCTDKNDKTCTQCTEKNCNTVPRNGSSLVRVALNGSMLLAIVMLVLAGNWNLH